MKAKLPLNAKVVLRTCYLTLVDVVNGLMLVPTSEGVEEARNMLFREPRCSILDDQGALLEEALGNGWNYVPPEDIGALTDASILSCDGFIDDFGHWRPSDGVSNPIVYVHANYAVEDPIEMWARGDAVFFERHALDQ